jgi:hypothetical protein
LAFLGLIPPPGDITANIFGMKHNALRAHPDVGKIPHNAGHRVVTYAQDFCRFPFIKQLFQNITSIFLLQVLTASWLYANASNGLK